MTVFSALASKPMVTVFFSLASKSVVTISLNLISKPVAQVSLSFWLKTGSYGLVIWVSKSPRQFLGLVHKTNQARVSQSGIKTGGCATMSGACGIIAKVVSSGS
jgi:hypothetical protein